MTGQCPHPDYGTSLFLKGGKKEEKIHWWEEPRKHTPQER